jgi:glutamyl-tRNA synthetase
MNNNNDIIVRFAPSPTGNLHIGGLRAALFNYIFAKQNNGKFLLRIEDTDLERSKQEYTEAIIDSFKWCNIESDEPLIFQSKRTEIYLKYIEKLVSENFAYWIDEANEDGVFGKVLKFKIPKDRNYIECVDIIRGLIKFPVNELEDFIIVRSDGTPLYNLVVVIDDIEMNISHIIRGEEHLSNTPKQILLYEAFKKTLPKFAHLPLILSPEGKKLSKRDAATAVIDYKKMGVLPEAITMYLIRLGWAYKDQEIFKWEELLKYFDLSKIHSSGARFDLKKLLWMNNIYIKNKTADDIYQYSKKNNLIDNVFFDKYKEEAIKLIDLYKDRAETLLQLFDEFKLILSNNIEYNKEILISENIKIDENLKILLINLKELFKSLDKDNFDIKTEIQNFAQKSNYDLSSIFKILRFAVIGKISSPSIYSIIKIMTPNNIIIKIETLLKKI